MPNVPRNRITAAEKLEQIFDALTDAEWPAIEKGLENSNSEEAVKSWELYIATEAAWKKYNAAVKAKNLDAVVAATADEEVRRRIYSQQFRGRGTPRGSRHPEQRARAEHARHLLRVLKTIWPTLRNGNYSVQKAREIVAAFVEQRLQWRSLPIGWHKTHQPEIIKPV